MFKDLLKRSTTNFKSDLNFYLIVDFGILPTLINRVKTLSNTKRMVQ